MIATLPIKDGVVLRDLSQNITKVALLDRYSGKIRISRMFWKDVGMKTRDSAMACSIVHDNHNAWVTGSSDESMAIAVNKMAEIDGGYVLVREGQVVATVRLEIGGLMTARSAEAFSEDMKRMRAEMKKIDWVYDGDFRVKEFLGVDQVTEALNYGFLTCQPWYWTLIPPTDSVPEGWVNIRTGETHPVVW
jgi:adenine deaminase